MPSPAASVHAVASPYGPIATGTDDTARVAQLQATNAQLSAELERERARVVMLSEGVAQQLRPPNPNFIRGIKLGIIYHSLRRSMSCVNQCWN